MGGVSTETLYLLMNIDYNINFDNQIIIVLNGIRGSRANHIQNLLIVLLLYFTTLELCSE